jgi:Domain of unknown function (DUF4020)
MSVNNSVLPDARLANVTEAASERFDWGLSLGRALANREAWESEIWKALCRAWMKGVSSDEQRAAVLSLLVKHPSLDRLADGVADLLVHWWWADKSNDPSTQLLSEGEKIADRIWAVSDSEPPLSEEPANGWLHEAINHPGGKVVQFWLYALSVLRKHAGDKWSGSIPKLYRDRFSGVMTGKGRAAQLGRVVIASQVRFVFALDPDWATESVLPMLDFAIDVKRARSAWDGFLSWGSWDEGILPKLLPLYERSFSHLLGADQAKRNRLCEHLANIAVFASINPLDHGWLDKFVMEADDEVRATWAAYVRQSLESLSDDKVAGLWGRWLARYWERRNHGYPKPLGNVEVKAMVEWVPHLQVVFTAAVTEVLKSPAPKFEYTSLFSRLLKGNVQERSPTELAQLLLHLMPTIPPGFSLFCDDLEKLVRGIPPSSIPLGVYKRLCDELGRIGCANAAAILASYQSAKRATGTTASDEGPSDVFELISHLRVGSRSKADIDSQIRQERGSWERDK